ncbi:MAG: hypothetical protein JWM44_2390 [Bacilli bacterium]|nr:hypothetical protein [Bacilli bacterium]
MYYWIAMNLFSFVIMGFDKRQAKKRQRRVPERNLFFFALIGGAIGAFIGMKAFRHKTQHPSFQYGIPVLVIVNVAAAYWIGKQL